MRVSPKVDVADFTDSLTYKDPQDSGCSLEALANSFASGPVIRTAAPRVTPGACVENKSHFSGAWLPSMRSTQAATMLWIA